MRRNRSYGRGCYSSYRGRSALSTPLKVIAVLLAVVLVLSVAALFFLEPYWVYSADGGRLLLPWVQENEEDSAPLPSVSQPLVVLTPEPEPEELLHALLLPQSALTDGSVQTQLEQAGATAALFDMKADDGALAFVSASPLAVSAGVNAATGTNEAIAALNAQQDLYTVARLSCFRDNTMPRYRNDLALRSSGGNWLDSDGIRWLSPAYQENQQYITDLCLELAGLGFDEILLDYAAFPLAGNLDAILTGAAYEPDTLAQTVQAFYTQVAAALEAAYPQVRLSVVADPAALTAGGASQSGQTLTMASAVDRVWVWGLSEERDACEELLAQAGLEAPKSDLVSIAAQAGPEDRSWALWT
ncbi:putative glycoside hydrolase [uncultured Intestinimonas sp.]|uniref:putative glycoside hydrolase n=1 Tax=uncultured Intestinimonas sp. TaxID=1689265 RepID=UPI0025F80FA8|nr:putative glycoside hydrolase [uncultured Intestinimonas sp.]